MAQDIGHRAYLNALEKRRKLQVHLEKLQLELRETEEFLRLLQTYAKEDIGGLEAASAPQHAARIPRGGKKKKGAPMTESGNPKPEETVKVSRDILVQLAQPLTRRQLVDALRERGLVIKAKKPVNWLGTILWRAKDAFIQLEGRGYWPKDIAYPPADYYPQGRPIFERGNDAGGSEPKETRGIPAQSITLV